MQDYSLNNKTIAKNTMFLYVRMLLSLVVSLYTSRVVLRVLGVEDYGIYGLVGGVVSMLSFLNKSMAGATSRFLTYEIGLHKDVSNLNPQRLRDTFSSAMIIHIAIGVVVTIILETFGLWFVCNKLVIPESRMGAAIWVYQFSIVSMLLGVTQVPYNASIIAHERMSAFAYIELLDVFLKLGVLFLFKYIGFDKLILYGAFYLFISILIRFIYRVYCIRNFDECHFNIVKDKVLFLPLLKFSGWELLGHLGFSFRTTGLNMVLNMLYGVAVNAANGIASTVQGTLFNFSGNINTAFKPQIIKSYARGEYDRMVNLTFLCMKTGLLMILLVSIPVIFEANFILTLWLKDVPKYSIDFCRLLLLTNISTSISQVTYIGITASGNLKITSLIRNFVYISVPFIIYFLFKNTGYHPGWSYIFVFFSQIILLFSDFWILSRLIINYKYTSFIKFLIKSIVVIVLASILCGVIYFNLESSWFRLLATISVSTLSIVSMFYFLVYNSEERIKLRCLITHYLHF